MDYAYRLQDEAYFLGSYEPMLINHPPAARCALDTVGVDHFIFGTDSPRLLVLKREGVDLINKIGLTERGEEQGLLREREEAAQAVARVVERSDTGCGFADFASLNLATINRRRYFFNVAPVSCAIAASVVCAAFRPRRKSLSEYDV
jgi:hypothetical protein